MRWLPRHIWRNYSKNLSAATFQYCAIFAMTLYAKLAMRLQLFKLTKPNVCSCCCWCLRRGNNNNPPATTKSRRSRNRKCNCHVEYAHCWFCWHSHLFFFARYLTIVNIINFNCCCVRLLLLLLLLVLRRRSNVHLFIICNVSHTVIIIDNNINKSVES